MRKIIDKAEEAIFQASQGKDASAPRVLKDLVPQTFDEILSVYASGGRPVTGYLHQVLRT